MPSNDSGKSSSLQLMAMNIAGAEFGEAMPGQHGHHYTWPRAANFERYKDTGIKLILLPFRWERIQHHLYGELDSDEMQRFMAALDGAHAAGMQVLLDMHNYYQRRIDNQRFVDIGSPEAPVDAWIDAWLRLVRQVKSHPAVWGYGMMNEPMGTNGRWAEGAQRCIDAVRRIDEQTPIIVAGDGFSTAQFWEDQNGQYFPLRGDNLIYEAHIYLDRDTSGRYEDRHEDIHPDKGIDRAKPFFRWLRANGQQGFIGELGVPENMPKAMAAMDRLLAYAARHQVPVFYWAGGSQWNPGHETACEYDGQLLGQVDVVRRHLREVESIGPVGDIEEGLPEEPGPVDPELPEPPRLKVASQWNPIFSGVTEAYSGGEKTEYAFRFPFFIGGGDVAELVLSLAHWVLPPASTKGQDIGNLLPIRGLSVEFNGIVQAVTFDGNRSMTLWDGASDVHADPLAAPLFGVEQFDNDAMGWIKGVISFDGAGKKVPHSWRTTHDYPGSSVTVSDPALTTLSDLYLPGRFSHYGVTPVAHHVGYCPFVLGRHVAGASQALFARGDGQSTNYGDIATGRGAGWFQRLLSLYPVKPASMNFAVPSATSICGAEEHRLEAFLRYCPDGGCLLFGSVDFNANPAPRPEDVLERLRALIAQCRQAKVLGPIAVGRLLPRTSSSDGWASEGGQTVARGWGPDDAPARFNELLAASAFDQVFANDAVRSPLEPCKWRPASDRLAFDGVHPASRGHEALAQEAFAHRW